MRYLGSAALTAASLVLLLATDHGGLAEAATRTAIAPAAHRMAGPELSEPGDPAVPVTAVSPVLRLPAGPPTVLHDSAWRFPAQLREVYVGAAFDTCKAPPLDTMQAWSGTSPYSAVGIYVSGGQRFCDQTQLTRDWVRQVRDLGWKLIPTHVGRQAPCTTSQSKPQHIDPAQAVQQGHDEADEAVRAMHGLGLGRGNPVYLDIEAYTVGNPGCTKAVVDFTVGWTQALHDAGYLSGFYSSINSGISDLAAAARAGYSPMPDAVWYARWNDRPDDDGSAYLGTDLWTHHQRLHQYHGEVVETYGGASLEIDRDQLDGPVAG